MNNEEMNKYAYELMIKNNPEEAIKNLMLLDKLREENKQLKERIDKVIEILGEYKHYSAPDEKQNSENEDIVDKSLEILKGDSNE